MSNMRNIECKVKSTENDLTEWERRKISEDSRNLFFAYHLDYLIMYRCGTPSNSIKVGIKKTNYKLTDREKRYLSNIFKEVFKNHDLEYLIITRMN